MKTYKLYLLRHGLTKANLEGRYCGTLDIPLCEEGIQQLNDLVDSCEYPYVETVYASPLLRARETAEILFPGSEYIAVDNLREASFGRFEGTRMKDLQDDEEFQKWIVPGSDYTPPGVEPSKNFYVRSREGLIQVIDDMMHRGIFSAAVVTHISVIGACMAALAYPKHSPYEWNCDPGRGFMVRIDPSLYLREPLVEFVSEIPFEGQDQTPSDEDPFDYIDL
ncbi:MAG: histidine phosphatase family protein [Oscillospiraceae bacterium]|nr:histidine phosphatase family protein [Oscillospiraceae bacterium]